MWSPFTVTEFITDRQVLNVFKYFYIGVEKEIFICGMLTNLWSLMKNKKYSLLIRKHSLM